MKHSISILLAAIALISLAGAAAQIRTDDNSSISRPNAVRFGIVDVYIDSGAHPLAAYQFELKATAGDIRFVGVENGDAAGFQDPPYYDPAAMVGDSRRIIVGAFNLGEKLPAGRVRIARLHLRIAGADKPVWDARLITAGGRDGGVIQANISVADPGEGARR